MTPLLALLLVTSAAEPTCRDLYDSSLGCRNVDETPLEGAAEEVSDPAPEPGHDFDPDAMAWRLVAASGVAMIGAGGFAVVGVLYRQHVSALAASGQLTGETYLPLANNQMYLRWGAMGMAFFGSLLFGTGAAFWVFDPRTGRTRPPFNTQ